jgi:hypothetical protein
MDLTKNIIYRSFTLNDENIVTNIVAGNGIGGGISGCVVDSVDYSDVDVVQFLEKRSLEDGMDAGDVYKGARRVRMAGTLYGLSRADLYDRWLDLRAALDPVLAQADEPADKGYQPLYFSIPTLDLVNFPSGYRDMRILVMPRAISAMIQKDSLGGDDEDSLAIPWQATFLARDPRITAQTEQDYTFTAGAPHTNSGNLVNRGNHYAVLNMLIEVTSAGGSIAVQAGTSVFTLTVPASTGNRIIRLKGDDKIITVEEGSVEVTSMSMIAFSGSNTWPQVQPGTHGYSVTFTGVTVIAGSHMWFWEHYA